MRNITRITSVSALALFALAGCGGGGDCDGGGFDGAGNCANSGPPSSIVISSPVTDAIVNNGNGTYRRKASATVRDNLGRPVADGTVIDLTVVDSIIITGTVAAPDSISGSTLSLAGATQTDGTLVPDLTTVSIEREGATGGDFRGIRAGDAVLLFNSSEARDKVRFVSADPTAANTLSVTENYRQSYPAYSGATYVVGASMLGVGIAGEDEDGNLTPGVVKTQGNEGVATFWVSYPSDVYHIMTGCTDPARDTRVSPVGSAAVYTVATAGAAATINTTLCFSPIAGFTIEQPNTSYTVAPGDSVTVSFRVRDGGDTVAVPFYDVTSGVDGDFVPTVDINGTAVTSDDYTNEFGFFTATITVPGTALADQSANVTFVSGDGSLTVAVSTPQ